MQLVPLDGPPENNMGVKNMLIGAGEKLISTSTTNNQSAAPQKSSISGFFTIVNEICKMHIWHILFYTIQMILPILQFIALHFWSVFTYSTYSSSGTGTFIKGIHTLLGFSFTNSPGTLETTSIIAAIATNVVTLAIIFATLAIHAISGYIPKMLIFIDAVALEIFVFAFVMPLGYIFGCSISGLAQADTVSIIVFFVSLILLVGVMFMLYLSCSTINYFSNPSESIFTSFTGTHTRLFFILETILVIIGQINSIFPSWYKYLVVIISIIIHIFLCVKVLSIPFATISGNTIAFGIYCYAITADILTLVVQGSANLPGPVYLALPFGVFLIASISAFFIFRTMIIRNTTMLTIDDNSIPSEFYADLEITHQDKALQYCRAAFIGGSISILNGNFPIWFAEKFNNITSWIYACSILAFVPGEHESFLHAYKTLSSMVPKGLIEQILVQRIMAIEQMRFSSNDVRTRDTYNRIREKTNNCIGFVRQFWSDVGANRSIPFNEVSGFGYLVNQTKKEWREIMAAFPNDPKFSELYAAYNLEGAGRFEDGVYWLVKSTHQEQGLSNDIDPLFRAFLISKPAFIHRRLVDKYGNVSSAMDGDFTLSMTMTTRTALISEKLEEEIDAGIIEKKSAELFQYPKLRAQVENITNRYEPPNHVLWTVLRVFGFLAIMAITIVIIVFLYISFNQQDLGYKQLGHVVNIMESLAYNNFFIYLKAANLTNVLYDINYYKRYIPDATSSSAASVDYMDVDSSQKKWVQTGANAYINFFKEFASGSDKGLNQDELIESITEKSINKTKCVGQYVNTASVKQMAVKSAAIETLWNEFALSDDELKNYMNNSVMCEESTIQILITPKLIEIMGNIMDEALNYSRERSKTNKITIIVFVLIFLFISLTTLFIPLINLNVAQNNIFKALLTVSPNSALEGSNPICATSSSEKLHSNVQSHISSYNSMFMVCMIIIVICLIIQFIFPIIGYTQTITNMDQFASVLKQATSGAYRGALAQRMLSLLTYGILAQYPSELANYSCRPPVATYKRHWNRTRITNEFINVMTQLQEANRFFLHGDNNDGMVNRVKAVSDLHVTDTCKNATTATPHDLYSCLGIDRGLSWYIYNTKELMTIVNATTLTGNASTNQPLTATLNSSAYIDVFHYMNVHLPPLLLKSRILTKDYLVGLIASGRLYPIIYGIISIVLGIFSHVFVSLVLAQQYHTIEGLLMLIRHLPPPVVAESKQIIDSLSLVKSEEVEADLDPLQVVFNNVASPILCVGENNVIEAANMKFMDSFGVTINEIVGRRINSIIQMPNPNQQEMTIEEQGAFHFIEKMGLMSNDVEVQNCSYNVNLTCVQGNMILVQMTAYPIKNPNNKTNFVVVVNDTRQINATRNELEALEKTTEGLLNQLIPRTIAAFIAGRDTNFKFIGKKGTVVVVRLNNAFDMVQHSTEFLDQVMTQLDSIASHNPPYMPIRTIGGSFFYIGGLFTSHDIAGPPATGIKLALAMKGFLDDSLPKNGETDSRFQIAVITGGPVICGLAGKVQPQFEVTGPIIDEANILLENAPSEGVIVAQSTKTDIDTNPELGVKFEHEGPTVLNQKTYLF